MRKLSILVTVAVTAALTGTVAAPAQASVHCPNGRVALTFDDGPDDTQTTRLLRILERHDAPATFFVLGMKARRSPALVARMHRDGFVVGNHTWDHPRLTSLSDTQVRRQLRSTNKAIKAAGAPRPTLMRPPYGLTSSRIRGVERALHLEEVLWTIDTTDWNYRSTPYIVRAALGGLRPHSRNVILMHDGVVNSHHTVAAVPGIIQGVRRRGYCLTVIGENGRPANPRPRLLVSPATVTERDTGATLLRIPVRLASPAVRPVAVRVHALNGSAERRKDFVPLRGHLRIRAGRSKGVVTVRILGDRRHERTERFRIRLSHAEGTHLTRRSIRVTVRDDDPAHRARVARGRR